MNDRRFKKLPSQLSWKSEMRGFGKISEGNQTYTSVTMKRGINLSTVTEGSAEEGRHEKKYPKMGNKKMKSPIKIIITIIALLLIIILPIAAIITAQNQTQNQQQQLLIFTLNNKSAIPNPLNSQNNPASKDTNNPNDPFDSYTNVTWTNPTISDVNYSQDLNITLNGNLKITENGELHLIHCILNVNNGIIPIQYGVQVYGGLYINESSAITAINPANPYYFTVYENATFQMNNSRVKYCGDNSGSWPDQQGLTVYTENTWIENNTITQGYNGLILYNSQGSTILNNTATNNNLGFYLYQSSNNTLSGNTATNNRWGFYLVDSSNNTLSGNTANNNVHDGFQLENSLYNTVSDNIATNNTGEGFYLYSSLYNTLSGNIATNNRWGFYLVDSSYNTLSGNTANKNGQDGFHLENGSYNNLSGNIATNNTGQGFSLVDSSNNNISGNTATNNYYGFYLLYNSNDNTLSGNTADNNDYGFYLSRSLSNTLSGNTVTNNVYYGFTLSYSSYNTLSGNTAADNNDYGFYLSRSSNNTLSGNSADNNDYGFFLEISSYNNLWGNTATNNNHYGFCLSSSLYNTFSNNTADNNFWGFFLEKSSYNTLSGNTAADNNDYGFYLYQSSNNTLSGNTATNNRWGFYLESSLSNTLSANTANNNDYGFYLSRSLSNTLSANTANNNGAGFYLVYSLYNTLSGNTATDNSREGFYLESCSYNTLSGNTAVIAKIYDFTVNITIVAHNTTDTCGRLHGLSLDQPLPNDFWNYLGYMFDEDGTGYSFTYTTIIHVSLGSHYVEYACSGYVPNYAWHARIYINNVLMAEGDVGRYNHLRAYFLATTSEGIGFYLNSSSYNTLSGNTANNNGAGVYLSYGSNNTLSGNTLNNNYYGFYLSYGSNNTLSGNTVNVFYHYYYYDGFYLVDSLNNLLSGNTATTNGVGFYLVDSSNNTLSGNAANNNDYGFYLKDSSYNNLSNNTATNNNLYGFCLESSSYNTLSVNTATNNYYGVYIDSSSYNTLSSNTATENGYGFCLVDSSYNNILSGNTANNNNEYGVYLSYGSNNTLSGNTVDNNGYYGVYLESSSYNILSGNTVDNNYYGVYLSYSSYNILSGNTANNTNNWYYSGDYYGFYLEDSSYNTLSGNTANNYYYGFGLYFSSNNTLSGNTANNNNYYYLYYGGYYYGFYLEDSSYNTLSGNTANNYYYGFGLYSSSYNTLSGNTANNNYNGYYYGYYYVFYYGFYLEDSSYNTLSGNAANNYCNGFGLYSSSNNNLSGNAANNNGYNGFYLVDGSYNTLSGNTATNNYNYGFYLEDSSNNNLSDNTATDSSIGFYLVDSSYNTLSGNTATNNYNYGFYLEDSSNNNLSDNTATDSSIGFYLVDGSYNTISGNTATNNTDYGFYLYSSSYGFYPLYSSSSYNTLSGNTANNSGTGFYLVDGSYNTISGNTATNNTDYGFYLYSSSYYFFPPYSPSSSSYNTLSGNTATDSSIGFYLYRSTYNTLSNNTAANNVVFGCGWAGFNLSYSSYNNLSGNIAINFITGYYWSFYSFSNNFTGSVWENYLRVEVTDVRGLPFPGVEIMVETDGTTVYATSFFGGLNDTTDPNGLTPWIAVPYKTFTGINQMTESITHVTVWYSSPWAVAEFSNNPRIVDMSTSHVETIQQQYTNITWTNPTITEINYSQYLNINLDGDLTITETGELHLIKCKLNVNDGYTPVQYGVKVYGGMYINDSSIITAINPANPYYFIVYENATFQMNNSRVEYCGYGSSSIDENGLVIRADNTWIENNTITQGYNGLILYYSQGNTILNNTATNNYYGFYLVNSSYNTLSGNTANSNAYCGFFLENSSYNTLSGNTANSNAYCGFFLENSSYNTLSGNTANSNAYCGFFLENSSYNTLSGNTANSNAYGFSLHSSLNNTLSGNTATNNLLGFYLHQSLNNTLSGNTANNSNGGFYLSQSSNNNLSRNIALNCTVGYYWSSDSGNNDFTGSFFGNYLLVNATDSLNYAISGVDVKVETNRTVWYATPHFGGSDPRTDLDGLTPQIVVPYSIFTGNDTMTDCTPVVTVWNSTAWFFNNPRTVNMSTPHMETFMADTLPPIVTITSPSNGAFINVTSVDITWTGSDNGVIDHYEVKLDAGSWINVGNTTTSYTLSLVVGYHTFYVTAFDMAHNYATESVSFAVGPDFAISPQNITLGKVGGTVYIYATVTNLGADYTGPITVIFFDIDENGNSTQIGSNQTIGGLLHGESKTVSVSWTFDQFHTVQVVVDPGNTIEEIDETNNVAQKNIYASRPAVQSVSSEFGVWKRSDYLGTFIVRVDVINKFTAVILDNEGPDLVVKVVFELNCITYDATRVSGGSWECALNMGSLTTSQNTLKITAYDQLGLISETKTITIHAIELPKWFKWPNQQIEWYPAEQKYVTVNIESIGYQFTYLDKTGEDASQALPGLGDTLKTLSFASEYSLNKTLIYYVNGVAKYRMEATYKGSIGGAEVSRFDRAEPTVDNDLNIQDYIMTTSVTASYTQREGVGFGFFIKLYFGSTEIDLGLGFRLGGDISIGVNYTTQKKYVGNSLDPIWTASYIGIMLRGTLYGELNALFVGARIEASVYTNIGIVLNQTKDETSPHLQSSYGDPLFGLRLQVSAWAFGIPFVPQTVVWEWRSPASLIPVEPSSATNYTSPRIASDNHGNAMMVWVQGRTDGNNTYPNICYSTWNGTGWGTSGYVSNDDYYNFDPALTYDSNGNVIAVWSRVPSNVTPQSDNLVDLFKNQEIVYSIWNGSAWSAPQQITNNTFADGSAAVTAGPDGKVVAVWVRDTDSNISTTNDTDLYYSVWDGTQWSPEAALTNNSFMDYSVSLAHDSKGRVIACWVRDLDGNLSTTSDTQLMYAMWDGTSWGPEGLVTTLNETKESPSVTFDRNDNALVTWVGGNESVYSLYCAYMDNTTGTWSEPEIVHEDPSFISKPTINVDQKNTAVIVWRGFVYNATENYFNGQICYATKNLSDPNAIWSGVKYLTNDNETNWMPSACITQPSNNLLVAWDKEGVVSNLTHPIKPDLALDSSDITFSNNYPSEGEIVNIMARVRNIGDVDAYNVRVDFYDGDPNSGGFLIGTQRINYLPYDGEVNVTCPWIAKPGTHNIYVVIDSLGSISEIDETNNVAYKSISTLPDLTVSPTDITFSKYNPSAGETITISATIHNQGGTSAENVLVQFYSNSVLIGSQTIPLLGSNDSTTVSTAWTAAAGQNNITVVIDPNNVIAEFNKENNVASTTMSILPDLEATGISLSGHELLPGENVTITTEIRNSGNADATGVLIEFFDGNPYINGTLIYSETTNLPMGGTHTSSFVWTPPQGIHQVFVVVNRENLIAESNETNNVQYDELVVKLVPDLTVLVPEIMMKPGYVKIIAPIQNIGEAGATGVVVALYDGDPATGGTMINGATILNIAAGETVNVSLTVYHPPVNEYLYIVVDPENTITESNETNNEATIKYIADLTPPTTTIDLSGTPGLNGWFVSPVTVNLTASDDLSGVDMTQYSFDNTTWNIYTGPFTITTEGVTTLYYNSTDNAGNVENTSTEVIMIDMTPPVTAISLSGTPGLNGWFTSNVDINLTANDNVSGIAMTEYSFDNTTWNTYTEPLTITAEGVTTVYYKSIDVAGNVETAKSETIKIDKTLPVTAISLSGVLGLNGWYISNVNVTLSPIDNTSGVNITEYSFDGTTWVTYTGPFTLTAEGSTTVYYNSTDNAGNMEATKTEIIKIDKTPPVTAISLNGTSGLNGWYTSNVNFYLSATDNVSGLNITEYSFDNTTWNTYKGPFTITAEGITTIYYRSTDNAGNVETTKSETIKIDKTPPTTVLIIGTHYTDGNGSIYVTSSTVFALTATDATPGSGVANTYYRINSGNWTLYVGAFNITGPIGTYTIDYYSVDNAGNKETPKTTTVIMEEAFQGCGGLLIGKQWFTGNATLFLSEHMIRIQVGDQIATWNIVKHIKMGQFEFYYGEGEFGKIILMIHRGGTSTQVFAVGGGVLFFSCTKPLTACENKR
ncbi:MAG: NosD domain-containing protein [Candidatus Freyarchaeum deiterrae]